MDTKEVTITGPGTDFQPMVDVRGPDIVQVEVSQDGGTLWVNIDGVCRLRVQDPRSMHVAGVVYR